MSIAVNRDILNKKNSCGYHDQASRVNFTAKVFMNNKHITLSPTGHCGVFCYYKLPSEENTFCIKVSDGHSSAVHQRRY